MSTKRLRLRPVALTDGAAAVDGLNDWETVRLLSRVPHPYSSNDWARYVRDFTTREGAETWAITRHREERLLGVVSVEPVDETGLEDTLLLGFWLHRGERRKGIMREAVLAVLAHVFRHRQVAAVVSGYFVDNVASGGLQLGLGFEKTACGSTYCKAEDAERPHQDVILTKERFLDLHPEG